MGFASQSQRYFTGSVPKILLVENNFLPRSWRGFRSGSKHRIPFCKLSVAKRRSPTYCVKAAVVITGPQMWTKGFPSWPGATLAPPLTASSSNFWPGAALEASNHFFPKANDSDEHAIRLNGTQREEQQNLKACHDKNLWQVQCLNHLTVHFLAGEAFSAPCGQIP